MDTDVFFFSLPLVVPSQGLPLLGSRGKSPEQYPNYEEDFY